MFLSRVGWLGLACETIEQITEMFLSRVGWLGLGCETIEHFHVMSSPSPSRLQRKQKTAAVLVYNEIGAYMAIFTKGVIYL